MEENNEPQLQREQSGNEIERTTRDIAEITALSMRPELNEKDRLAIRLRYEGKDSASIAETTGFNESYVRRLFMKDGRLAGRNAFLS